MFIIAYTCTFSSCANYHVSPSKYSTLQPLSKGETPQSQNKANLWTQMQPFAHQFVMQMCGPMSIPKVHKQNGRLHCKVIYKKIPHLLSPGGGSKEHPQRWTIYLPSKQPLDLDDYIRHIQPHVPSRLSKKSHRTMSRACLQALSILSRSLSTKCTKNSKCFESTRKALTKHTPLFQENIMLGPKVCSHPFCNQFMD